MKHTLGLWLAVAACTGDAEGTRDKTPPVLEIDEDGDSYAVEIDCDDLAAEIHPGADEHCDGLDEDCDGIADNEPIDALSGFIDEDGDGFGSEPIRGCEIPPDAVASGGDCEDANPEVFPGAGERCNGIDDDCDPGTPDTAQIENVGFRSLAEAVELAGDGDIVEVCDGTFVEHGIIVLRDVTVASLSGDRDAVVIDGGGAGTVFKVQQGGALTLRSLTVVNGRADEQGGAAFGGAVNAGSAPLIIEDCLLRDNRAGTDASGGVSGRGGAVYGWDITLIDSEFRDNRALNGGAIYAENGSFSVSGCTFAGNQGDNGGAFYSYAHATVLESTFTDNSAAFGGAGYVDGNGIELLGVAFDDNVADQGGALYVEHGVSTADEATTFTGNRAAGGYLPAGGGLFLRAGQSYTSWTGGTFLQNQSTQMGGAVYVDTATLGTAPLTEVSGLIAEGNSATRSGGGVYLWGSNIHLTDSVLTANTSEYGGGSSVNSTQGQEVLIERVEYRSNIGTSGGASDVWQAELRMVDCVVEQNTANRGGGLLTDMLSSVTVESSDFGEGATDNLPDDVFIGDGGSATLSYTTFGADASFSCLNGGECL